jgi:hypothetical protein
MTAEYRPPLRHRGHCGTTRRRCYRRSCREQFDPYKTVEILANEAIFYCHRSRLPVDATVINMIEAAA